LLLLVPYHFREQYARKRNPQKTKIPDI